MPQGVRTRCGGTAPRPRHPILVKISWSVAPGVAENSSHVLDARRTSLWMLAGCCTPQDGADRQITYNDPAHPAVRIVHPPASRTACRESATRWRARYSRRHRRDDSSSLNFIRNSRYPSLHKNSPPSTDGGLCVQLKQAEIVFRSGLLRRSARGIAATETRRADDDAAIRRLFCMISALSRYRAARCGI